MLAKQPLTRPAALVCNDRGELIQMILDDLTLLTKSSSSNRSRLTAKGACASRSKPEPLVSCCAAALPVDAAQALLAIKSLGKHPAGSQVVATRQNLTALLAIFNTFKDEPEPSNEALKCICNALLLIEQGRSTFVQKDVGGGDAVMDLLEVRALRPISLCALIIRTRLQKTSSPERIFLCSRLIFLTTVSMASAGDYIRSIVESKPPGHHGNVIEIVAVKLDSLTSSILGSEKMAREAMSELLKAAFNLLLHYPRVRGSILPFCRQLTAEYASSWMSLRRAVATGRKSWERRGVIVSTGPSFPSSDIVRHLFLTASLPT